MKQAQKLDDDFFIGEGIIPHPLSSRFDELMVAPIDNPDFLVLCYKYGVFPWYEWNDSGVFFFPSKRFVIPVGTVKVPKSIKSAFNQRKFTISIDSSFHTVINYCKDVKRKDQKGSWISDKFVNIYSELHSMGYAHSVEVWDHEGNLAGGLYGVSIGKIFTGESMFSLQSGASRFALIALDNILSALEFKYIDCQLINPYLETFGGQNIHKTEFFNIIRGNMFEKTLRGNWGQLVNFMKW